MWKFAIAPLVFLGVFSAGADSVPPVPWKTDLKVARESALKAGMPLVVISNVDAPAL